MWSNLDPAPSVPRWHEALAIHLEPSFFSSAFELQRTSSRNSVFISLRIA
jgi:hypothetical protein